MVTAPTQIKVNELRVGNWVNLEFVGPFQWDWKHFAEYVKDKRDGYGLSHLGVDAIVSDKIEPIPFTDELLEKCGFVKLTDCYTHRIDEYIWLRIYEDGKYGFWSDSVENESDFTVVSQDNRIGYLHQLQNLYFSLTGQELNVEL